MRKNRFITNNTCPYEYLNVFCDKDKIVVRLLNIPAFPNNRELFPANNLYSFKSLYQRFTKVHDQLVYVTHETFFDKNDVRNKRAWCPSSNIVCFLKKDRLWFEEKSALTFVKRYRTNWFLETEQISAAFQMFVWDSKDSIDEVCKGFTAKSLAHVITNIDTRGILFQSAEDIAVDSSLSHYFQPHFRLSYQNTAKPEEMFEVKVESFNGDGEHININHIFELDAISGYLPHKRIELVDGYGSFKAKAFCLEKGDEMRIKFGKKISPSLAECIIKITN